MKMDIHRLLDINELSEENLADYGNQTNLREEVRGVANFMFAPEQPDQKEMRALKAVLEKHVFESTTGVGFIWFMSCGKDESVRDIHESLQKKTVNELYQMWKGQ